jgi:hypothetical protein
MHCLGRVVLGFFLIMVVVAALLLHTLGWF